MGLLLPLIELFYYPNLLLSISLPQAEPAYDHAWQTFQPWKHCLFLAVICAAAAKKKGLRRISPPSFPRNVNKMDTLIIYSLYQPTLFRSEAIYSLLSDTIAWFWPCVFQHFFTLIPHLFLPLSVQNPAMREPNKTKGFFSCMYIHRHYFVYVPWLLVYLCKLDWTWSCIKKKFCPEFWKGNWNVHNEKRKEKYKIQVH